MKLLADFHTHSKNSVALGGSTIEQLAIAANSLGLKELGIADYGYKHKFHTTKEKMIAARREIDSINEWSETRILLGIEASIISEDGTIDVDNETLALLDFLIVGYHRFIKTDFAGYFGGKGGTQGEISATKAFVNAINKYPVSILAHPNSHINIDLQEVGRACNEKGVMVELNNRNLNFTDAQIFDLLESGCMFVVSSDAKNREKVGQVDGAFELIKKYKIPTELVANVEFSEEEKTALHKEIDSEFSDYYKRRDARRKRDEALAKSEEFTGIISKEMEDELVKIAQQKGIKYVPRNRDSEEALEGADDEELDELIELGKQKLREQGIEFVPEDEEEDNKN